MFTSLTEPPTPELHPLEPVRGWRTRVRLGVDKQGRVTLDEPNRRFAAIDAGGQATVIGNGYTIEIWRPSRWAIVRSEDFNQTPDRVWPAEVDAR